MKTVALCFVALFAGAIAFDRESDRIIGGKPVRIEDHPYQLQLRFDRLIFVCGASILTDTRALTAAHCINPVFHPPRYTVAGGSALRKPALADVRTLSNYTLHPKYAANSHANDIAVLQWAFPGLIFGPAVNQVSLPAQNSPVPYGQNANVTGWGLTNELDENSLSNHLLFASVPLVSNEKCHHVYKGRITPGMFCAGVSSGGRGYCTGDDGGPLVLNGVQVGVASWTLGCGRVAYPQVYTYVAHYANWIRKHL